MVEDDESAAPGDVIRVIGLSLGFQSLDLSLKFAKPRVHIVRKFLGRLVLLGQAVEFGLRSIKGGLIFRRKLHRMGIRPAQTMGVRKVEMGWGPFPTLGLPQGICRASELSG